VDSKGFKYQHKSKDYIQTISKNGLLWFRMESNFIIQDKKIFVNINYFDSKVNWPSFFRIKKYINELIEKTNASAHRAGG
jgi:peptide methionine sulfoxide reductase MsrB